MVPPAELELPKQKTFGTAPNHLIHKYTAAALWLSPGIPPVIVAGMLSHSISILLIAYAHFHPYLAGSGSSACDKSHSLGFSANSAAQLMDNILAIIPIELISQSYLFLIGKAFLPYPIGI